MTVENENLIDNTDPDRLKSLLEYWKNIYGVLSGVFTFLPLGGFAVSTIFPPGWLETALPLLGTIGAAITIACLYFMSLGKTAFELKQYAIRLFIAALVLLLAFVLLRARYVVTVDDDRHLLGLFLTSEAQAAVDTGRIANTPKDLLDYFGHESEPRIWDYRWIVEGLFFIAFFGTCACIAGGFFLFTLAIKLVKQPSF
jgi:hypothetical protein